MGYRRIHGELANRYLAHLATRGFSSGTVRAYAYDLLNFSRFLVDRRAGLPQLVGRWAVLQFVEQGESFAEATNP